MRYRNPTRFTESTMEGIVMVAIDHVLAETGNVKIGAFRCPVSYANFRDTGPIENHLVVFPRTGVRIRHSGSRWFVADPGLATIYNRGQEYQRGAIAPEGDRSDWFAVSPAWAVAIARAFDPSVEEGSRRPFAAECAPVDTALYLRQRALFLHVLRGEADPLDLEHAVLEIVSAVIAPALAARTPAPHRRSLAAHRDLADRARAELARDIAAPTSVTALSGRLGVSPYHLCRVFREQTGTTLHQYRLRLRVRVALELLSEHGADLSRIAHTLGFTSHSHFTATMRRYLDAAPSRLRRMFSSCTAAMNNWEEALAHGRGRRSIPAAQ